MNEGLKIGDLVTYCKEPEGFRHNALIIGVGDNGKVALVHIVKPFELAMPQVELNVPYQIADEDGRYYEA